MTRFAGLITLGRGARLTLVTPVMLAIGVFGALNPGVANADGGASPVMRQLTGARACTSSDAAASCSADLYGGSAPRAAASGGTTVTTAISNVGASPAAALTLVAGPCVAHAVGSFTGSGDLCDALDVTITTGATTLLRGTAAELGASGTINLLAPLNKNWIAPNETVTFTITTAVREGAPNSVQGQTLSQPLTWTFTA